MCKLDCECKLKYNGKECDSKKIFDIVLGVMPKFKIDYGTDIIKNEEFKNGKLSTVVLASTPSSIDDSIKESGIYFIVSADEKSILYVGKSQNLNARLTQHLVKCPSSTHSHIDDVYRYLLEQNKQGKATIIKYCVINTSNASKNATIEGMLLDYIEKNPDDGRFGMCWNTRFD